MSDGGGGDRTAEGERIAADNNGTQGGQLEDSPAVDAPASLDSRQPSSTSASKERDAHEEAVTLAPADASTPRVHEDDDGVLPSSADSKDIPSSAPSLPTQLPKNDSLSSFTTAPDRNSIIASPEPRGGAALSKRDTMGSLSMARIAEEASPAEDTSTSTPTLGPRDSNASIPQTTSPATQDRKDADSIQGKHQMLEDSQLDTEARRTSGLSPLQASEVLPDATQGFTASRSSSTISRQEGLASAAGSQATDARSSVLLGPTGTSLLPLPIKSHSPSLNFSGPRVAAHSTLVAVGFQAGEAQQGSSKDAATTQSVELSNRNTPSLPSLSNDANPAISSSTASTADSSSTPRPIVPASTGETKSSPVDEGASKMTESFKIPNSVAPASVHAPSGPYTHAYNSPSLQRDPSQQQLQYDSNDTSNYANEPLVRTTTRYSHAAYSSTHPPVTTSSHHAAAMQAQRSSAPILAPALPPNAYGYPSTKHQQSADKTFVSSPINMLSDAGFGSSSPYPPIGSLQQQRYSLPVQASSIIPTFTQPFPAHTSANMAPTASLRPQPTTTYNTPGSSKHLPEMHPSALEARPSISAPFPPSSSPPRNSMKGFSNAIIAAPAALQQRERPDTSRPLGQEICLECLMRDRDMADVEVTGPGIWSRDSDIDFEEALRAEEIAFANAQHQSSGTSGNYSGSSMEDHVDVERRSQLVHHNGQDGGAGRSTDENVPQMLPPQSHGGRYAVSRDGGQIRSPSRESSLSEKGSRGYRRQPPPPRRRLGIYDPLTSASLKLWTQMNHVSSAHRYKVLADFVHEQTHLIEQERQAYEQSLSERDRADRALRDSPAKMSMETRSSMSAGLLASNGGTTSPKLLDLRRGSKGRVPLTQYLPNGMMVETIDVQHDEKEAKARAKAAAKSKRSSSQSPNDQRKSYAPSIKSINGLSMHNNRQERLPSPTGSFAPPWMADERRRFSSPMLSNKYRNASSDNLAINKQYNDPNQDLRMSSYSMMTPPLRGFRSPSPSRQSFQTGVSQRESRGWRKSLWPRSASASVASFPQSGSMMEMHLGMSQDRHDPMPAGYTNDQRDIGNAGLNGAHVMHAPGATWPDNASEPGDHGGINPDESVEAAKEKKHKKKRFQKLFNSLLGTHHNADKVSSKSRGNAALDQHLNKDHVARNGGEDHPQQQYPTKMKKPQTSFNYAAAYHDDYSEPLAPPPPLSYLTGQQPHTRTYSSSSQSSYNATGSVAQSPRLHGQEVGTVQQNATRPNSLAVPRNNANSSNGFISPSTSSSDLSRNRPSSVTSWRSSSNKTTGSPQSPRELLSDSFGHPLPAIRQASFEEMASGMRAVDELDLHKDVDSYQLRKEKSLPALPPGEYDGRVSPSHGPDLGLHRHMPNIPYEGGQNNGVISYGAAAHATAPVVHEIYGDVNGSTYQHAAMYPGTGPEWEYNTHTREHDYDGTNSIGKASKKTKMRSRLFSFGNKKGRSSTSPPPLQSNPHPPQETYFAKGYAPHEAALQAVVRDSGDMVAYKYPSTASPA